MALPGAWLRRTNRFGVSRLLAVSSAMQYALLVQARNDDDDCIGNTLGKLACIVKNS